MEVSIPNTQYQAQFDEIRLIIDTRKKRAYKALNNEIILSNWEIGRYVSDKIKSAKWGSKVIDMLVVYLKEKIPGIKGYEKRSIERMVRFYNEYSSVEFASAIPTQIKEQAIASDALTQFGDDAAILFLLVQVGWSAHLEIMSGCTSPEERIFYILLSNRENLTYQELRRQIDACVYERSLLGNNNQSLALKNTYPDAGRLFKDTYMVDFLGLPENYSEKSLQAGLVKQMKSFILELGKDFLFVGEEYRVQVGMKDFRIDLLFFHRGLQCLVAMEIKINEFKPEYLGQLDFYLEALDRDVKKENENPSIGILLCKSADSQVVEYALNRSLSPTMIAEYKRQLIPKEILQKHLKEILDK
ncbi:PDDEXK nuclease domain-containing protein [Bacteroides congonensis]|jgi:predicted nuclease of restriction endonuclease-like (RecB) superfamily|uniref:PDDEXK nuclease domain-containing protein n=1 Tax=Bacteroides congonensis TaxID=1871006 RepID=UPI0018A07B41|nr:PDDEXK nuclease domain-containing protein [Bacteroides congonensis]